MASLTTRLLGTAAALVAVPALVGCSPSADPDELLGQLGGAARCLEEQLPTSADDEPTRAVCRTPIGTVSVNVDPPDPIGAYFATMLDEGWFVVWHEEDRWTAATPSPELAREVARMLDGVVVTQSVFRERFLD